MSYSNNCYHNPEINLITQSFSSYNFVWQFGMIDMFLNHLLNSSNFLSTNACIACTRLFTSAATHRDTGRQIKIISNELNVITTEEMSVLMLCIDCLFQRHLRVKHENILFLQ